MDLVLRYLENSVRLRNLAATESDPRVRAELERHAEAYRKLAAQRAKERNLPGAPIDEIYFPHRVGTVMGA